ncbi:MAG: MBL fold metallo-hydrolase [Bacteroidales bacterium]|nr:MBL fold metallo-hydrolase [Bacteroidales bacterium]
MKKMFAIALASLMLVSCAQKTKNVSTMTEPTTIAWIEDKPGPTLQNHRIYPSVPDSLWEALGLQEGVPSSMSCFLLKAEGKTILLDAGLGSPASQLLPKLKEAGVTPDDLELIYISHMHPDHIGGLLKDGGRVFPNAGLWINRVEAEAWKAMDAEKASLPHAVLSAYEDNLHLFEAGDTLAGGVVAMAAYGHTPGHTVFQKDSILIISDLVHGAALQLGHPEYCPFYDMDPETATASRKRLLEYARKNRLTMYGMHLPEPGFVQAP